MSSGRPASLRGQPSVRSQVQLYSRNRRRVLAQTVAGEHSRVNTQPHAKSAAMVESSVVDASGSGEELAPAEDVPNWAAAPLTGLLLVASVHLLVSACRSKLAAQDAAAKTKENDDAAAEAHANEVAAAPAKRRVDTSSLTGLRGIAAFQVAAGHYIFRTSWDGRSIGFMWGGTAMPFFYLLSGFIMALAYGSKSVVPPCGLCDGTERDAESARAFSIWWRRFARNRFARLVPVYLLTNVLAVPLFWIDGPHHGNYDKRDLALRGVLSALGLTSWTPIPFASGSAGRLLFPINSVTWTICTMLWFYVMFPFAAPYIQRWSAESKRRGIVGLYVLQLLTWYLIWLHFDDRNRNGYWPARSHPLGRAPVFFMGVCAAYHRLQDDERETRNTQMLHAAYADASFGLLLMGIGLMNMWEIILTKCALNPDTFYCTYWAGRPTIEACCPLLQVCAIISLSRDGGKSQLARLCKTKAMQRLGDISMSFYMIHWLLALYVCLLFGWDFHRTDQGLHPHQSALLIVCSLVVGFVLTEIFEKPANNALRTKVVASSLTSVDAPRLEPGAHGSVLP